MKKPVGSFTSRVEQFDANATQVATVNLSPEEQVRAIVANAIAPAILPPTKQFQIRYIRGIDDANEVVFLPQFLYLLDADLGPIAGVSLSFKAVGLGAPKFPDFSTTGLLSVQGWSPNEIIYPAVAGQLLVVVVNGVTPDEVYKGLADYALGIQPIGGNSYVLRVTPFSEQRIQKQIAQLPFIASVDFDWIVRIIDGVRWLEDRVA